MAYETTQDYVNALPSSSKRVADYRTPEWQDIFREAIKKDPNEEVLTIKGPNGKRTHFIMPHAVEIDFVNYFQRRPAYTLL